MGFAPLNPSYELLNEDASGAPLDPDRLGLAREPARINLTLGFYTQSYWKIDLHTSCISYRCAPIRMRNTRSAPMPRRCSTS
jgi:thymidylate synthase ThyX